MKKSLLVLISFLFLSFIKTNFVYGDRLLIGFKRTVYDVMDKRNGETGSGWDNYLEFCKKDGNSDNSNSLSKKYENECPNGITNKDNIYEPSLELEIDLTDFQQKGGWGINFIADLNNKNEIILIDYPNDNETSTLSWNARFAGLSLLYTWGDPSLGKDGNWAIRVGGGPSFIYYDPIILQTKEKTVSHRGTANRLFLYFSWDWNNFSLIHKDYLPLSGDSSYYSYFEEIKDSKNRDLRFALKWHQTSINFSIYF